MQTERMISRRTRRAGWTEQASLPSFCCGNSVLLACYGGEGFSSGATRGQWFRPRRIAPPGGRVPFILAGARVHGGLARADRFTTARVAKASRSESFAAALHADRGSLGRGTGNTRGFDPREFRGVKGWQSRWWGCRCWDRAQMSFLSRHCWKGRFHTQVQGRRAIVA
jgi:hypothetical protein